MHSNLPGFASLAGYVGRQLVDVLVDRGVQVRALVRTRGKLAAARSGLTLTPVRSCDVSAPLFCMLSCACAAVSSIYTFSIQASHKASLRESCVRACVRESCASRASAKSKR